MSEGIAFGIACFIGAALCTERARVAIRSFAERLLAPR